MLRGTWPGELGSSLWKSVKSFPHGLLVRLFRLSPVSEGMYTMRSVYCRAYTRTLVSIWAELQGTFKVQGSEIRFRA